MMMIDAFRTSPATQCDPYYKQAASDCLNSKQNSTIICAQCPVDALGSMNTAVQNSCKNEAKLRRPTTTDHHSCARQSISYSNELSSPHPRAPNTMSWAAGIGVKIILANVRVSWCTGLQPPHITILRPSFSSFPARRSISYPNELPSGVREAWRGSISTLTHPNMMSWGPASTSTSSLPTCSLPAC